MSEVDPDLSPTGGVVNKPGLELGMGRHEFLMLGAAAGAGVLATLVGVRMFEKEAPLPPVAPNSAYDSGEKKLFADQLTQLVSDGLREKWTKMAVFPGLFLASPGAKFYADAALTKEVDLGLSSDARAVILRPNFPGETLRLGAGIQYTGDDLRATQGRGLDTDTFAFMSPTAGGVVFGNYSQNIERIDMLSRLHGDALSYTSKTKSNIPMQFIDIAARKEESGMVVPSGIDNRNGEKAVFSDTPNEYGGREYLGHYKATTYFAMAQGRVWSGADNINRLIDDFRGNSEIVQVEPDLGEFVPREKER